jgi:hypothetical protein
MNRRAVYHWARSNGCPIHEITHHFAMAKGWHLRELVEQGNHGSYQHYRAQGCPCDEETRNMAEARGWYF